MGNDTTGIRYDAFISFSSQDLKLAEGIVFRIEQRGLKCFISSRDVNVSDNWAERIVECMDASRMVVYIHTKAANDSVQISREIQRAVDVLKKPFVAYRLSDEDFKGSKAFFIQSLNWIDSLVDPYENLDKLVQFIQDVKDGNEVRSFKQSFKPATLWIRRNSLKFSLMSLLFIVMVSLFSIHECAREKAMSDARSASEYYYELINKYNEIDHIIDPSLSVSLLESIDSISSSYMDSKFSVLFKYDTPAARELLLHDLDSARCSLLRIISSYFEGYTASPVDALRRPILEKIEMLEAIDNSLGMDTDSTVLAIKRIIL